MNALLVAPVVWPLATAALLVLLRGRLPIQRTLSTASAAAQLALAAVLLAQVATQGILVVQIGGWEAPFGISFVADHLAAVMVLVNGIMATAVAVYALRDLDADRERLGYHPMFHVLLAGVNGAFLTGDLFNLYVWFELLLIASFVLLTLGNRREQLEGGIKYVAANLVASMLLLTGIGLLYGATGTLNMADLALKLPLVPVGLSTTLAMLFLVAFGIKAAIFPLFFWLPASYHTPPVAVSALFGGMLTKVGVYALLRGFTLLFVADVAVTHGLLAWIAGITMVVGVLGAAAQTEFRKILSFHIVSQIGYMVMGLAFFTPLGLGGAVFYMVHNILAKANLFLIAGIARWYGGSFELKKLGGLYRHRPLLAVLFVIAAFSLAGFPPLSGFWAKLVVIRAGFEVQAWPLVAVSLFVGLLTLYSMTKIWLAAFWSPVPEGTSLRAGPAPALLYAPVVALAALTLAMGFASAPFFALAERIGAELTDPAGYVLAVLGEAAAAAFVAQGVAP